MLDPGLDRPASCLASIGAIHGTTRLHPRDIHVARICLLTATLRGRSHGARGFHTPAQPSHRFGGDINAGLAKNVSSRRRGILPKLVGTSCHRSFPSLFTVQELTPSTVVTANRWIVAPAAAEEMMMPVLSSLIEQIRSPPAKTVPTQSPAKPHPFNFLHYTGCWSSDYHGLIIPIDPGTSLRM